MKLVASMPVRNELERYLKPCVRALLEYVDEIRVLDDESNDGSYEWLREQTGVRITTSKVSWEEHEGKFRQELLDWTREGDPTHILAIDADEFVADGPSLRDIVRRQNDQMSFSLNIREVWSTDPWLIREDGGWRSHEIAILYRTPQDWDGVGWQLQQRKLAGGRVPRIVRAEQRIGQSYRSGIEILHLGWSREKDREARWRRYVDLDDGKYHSAKHLDSIMWSTEDCLLVPYRVPFHLKGVR